jgi:hypothetical protein
LRLPFLPPFCCSRLSAPRPPVSFLIALRSLTRPLVSCRAFVRHPRPLVGRSRADRSQDRERLLSLLARRNLVGIKLKQRQTHISHRKREKSCACGERNTDLALDVLLATLALELVVKLAETGRALLGRLEHLLDFALALIPLRVLGRRVLSLLRGLLGGTLPLVLERARFPLVAGRSDRVKVRVCSSVPAAVSTCLPVVKLPRNRRED